MAEALGSLADNQQGVQDRVLGLRVASELRLIEVLYIALRQARGIYHVLQILGLAIRKHRRDRA